jgi:hypothetical protein
MDRKLFTLAVPELSKRDQDWIDARRFGRADYPVPHFTVAFGIIIDDQSAFLAHVDRIAARFAPVAFQCNRVVLGTDHRDETGYTFLVPDVGESGVLALHDAVYSGFGQLDAPFVPHITLGRYPTAAEANDACEILNSEPVSVSGVLSALSVVAQGEDEVSDVAVFKLRG